MSTGGRLTAKIMKHIREAHNGFPINIISASAKGMPDIVACIDGQLYAFEVKSENDREKALQSEQLARIAKAGGCGGYVYNTYDVDVIVAGRIKFVNEAKTNILKL